MEQEEQELTLKDLLFKIKEFLEEIKQKWWFIITITVLTTSWFGYKAFTKPITYTAGLTFMLNEDNGGGIASMLGQFGGLLGGGGGEYQLEKIMEIVRSRRILGTTLFTFAEIDGSKDYLANHLIRINNVHKKWNSDNDLKGFLFTHGKVDSFSRSENKALLALQAEVLSGKSSGIPVLGTAVNEETGIMTLSAKTRSESLSIALINTLFKELSAFYLEKSVGRERETLNLLIAKRDSLYFALNQNDVSTASFDDRNNNLLLQTDKVPSVRNRRNNQVLSAMYAEAVKNVEVAEFALNSRMPFITAIDTPVAPIYPDPRGRATALILGILIGLTVSSTLVIVRKTIKDAIN